MPAAAYGNAPDPGELETVSTHLRVAMAHARLTPGLAWGWDSESSPDLVLWTVSRPGPA